MSVQNESIIITKQTMDSYATIQFKNYTIGYYLQKDPKKDICEDALLVRTSNSTIMLAVCDGVGGSDRSYRASKNTLTWLNELPINTNQDDLHQELNNINNKLIKLEGSPQTTLTLVILDIKTNSYTCWQAGDSGLLHTSNRSNLKYKSPIHSPVGQELAEGRLTEKEALLHPELHVVSNVLGSQDFYIDYSGEIEIAQHDTLLLTSDGLLDNFLTDEFMSYISKGDINQACNGLHESAVAHKNTLNDNNYYKIDDISFICLKSINTQAKNGN